MRSQSKRGPPSVSTSWTGMSTTVYYSTKSRVATHGPSRRGHG